MITTKPTTPQDLKIMTKQRDLFKAVLIAICILSPCILAAAIYFYFKKSNIALFIPAVTIILAAIPVYLRFKSLDAELKTKS